MLEKELKRGRKLRFQGISHSYWDPTTSHQRQNITVSETGLFHVPQLNLGPGEMSLTTFSLVSSTVSGTKDSPHLIGF